MLGDAGDAGRELGREFATAVTAATLGRFANRLAWKSS